MTNHDTAHPASNKAARFCALFWFAAGVVACLVHALPDLRLDWDNRYYYFIAERAASGVPPHVSQFDPKHALGLLLSAAGIAAGRVVGAPDLWAARAVSIGFAGASVALVWALALRLSKRHLAAHLAALAMLAMPEFFLMAAMGARPKVFLVPFVLLTLLAAGRRRAFLTGCSGALAFLCWQVGALFAAVGCVVVASRRPAARSIGRFALGVLVPLVLYHAYFLAQGALGALIEQAYVFPVRFMEHGTGDLAGNASTLMRFEQSPGTAAIVPLLALLALVAFWIRFLSGRREWLARIAAEPTWAAFLIGAHLAAGFTLYGTQGFPDRFLIEPLAAVAVGLMVSRAIELLPGNARRGAALVSGPLLAILAVVDHRALAPMDGLARQREEAARVGRLIDEGKRVYVVAGTHVLAFEHADNFVPVAAFFRGVQDYVTAGTGSDEYHPLVEGAPPDVIVVDGPIPPPLRWIRARYRLTHETEIGARKFRIFE